MRKMPDSNKAITLRDWLVMNVKDPFLHCHCGREKLTIEIQRDKIKSLLFFV